MLSEIELSVNCTLAPWPHGSYRAGLLMRPPPCAAVVRGLVDCPRHRSPSPRFLAESTFRHLDFAQSPSIQPGSNQNPTLAT